MGKEIMEALKAIIGPEVFETGGKLNPTQGNKFVDYMVDQTVLLKMIDVMRIPNPNGENIDSLAVGSRLLRKAIDGQKMARSGITTSQKQILLTKTKLVTEMYDSALRTNIEGAGVKDHVMRLLASQIGNDLEDLAANGDTTSTDEFLSIDDGLIALLKANANVYDTNTSQDFKGVVFPGMISMMPNKYKANKTLLKFFVCPDDAELYAAQLRGITVESGFQYLIGGGDLKFDSIQIVPVAYFPQGTIVLSHPKNLVQAIDPVNIQVETDRDIELDSNIVVMRAYTDYLVRNDEAAVIAYDEP